MTSKKKLTSSNVALNVPISYTGMFSKPRMVTALLTTIAFLAYTAMFMSPSSDAIANIKRGLIACGIVFLLVASMLFPNSPFIRPHPVFWRIALGIAFLYQLFLTFLMFQSKDDARRLFKLIDSSLGVQLPERSYAEDCTFCAANLWNQCDLFVIAHLFGWYVKGLLYRDYWLLWIMSVMFEVMEYSLQHQLPNFAECWWDHWIMDVATCNALGIYLGMKTCSYLSMKGYCWRGMASISSYSGKFKRSLQQFTPYSWSVFEWEPKKSFDNYLAVVVIVATTLQCEVNLFYMKYLLWIPADHWLNLVRLVIVVTVCAPAISEFYRYAVEHSSPSLGAYAWLVLAIIWTETLLCVKFSTGEFPTPAPLAVKVFWAIFLTLLVVYPICRFSLRKKQRTE